jgi:hypothetical protein
MLRRKEATVSLADDKLTTGSLLFLPTFGSFRHRPSAPSVLTDLLENRACFCAEVTTTAVAGVTAVAGGCAGALEMLRKKQKIILN